MLSKSLLSESLDTRLKLSHWSLPPTKSQVIGCKCQVKSQGKAEVTDGWSQGSRSWLKF